MLIHEQKVMVRRACEKERKLSKKRVLSTKREAKVGRGDIKNEEREKVKEVEKGSGGCLQEGVGGRKKECFEVRMDPTASVICDPLCLSLFSLFYLLSSSSRDISK